MNEEVVLDEKHIEIDDWHLFVSVESHTVKCWCCPDDKERDREPRHSHLTCCTSCVAPMCTERESNIWKRSPEVPPAARANRMMICYAPTELYGYNATVMEMICASVYDFYDIIDSRKDTLRTPFIRRADTR